MIKKNLERNEKILKFISDRTIYLMLKIKKCTFCIMGERVILNNKLVGYKYAIIIQNRPEAKWSICDQVEKLNFFLIWGLNLCMLQHARMSYG